MTPHKLLDLLKALRKGALTPEEAMRRLKTLPFVPLDGAHVDTHRELRCGHPEVIFCQGKTPAQITRIARVLLAQGSNLLATRADRAAYLAVRKAARGAVWHEAARCVTVCQRPWKDQGAGLIQVVTAGTSDLPVAEEARVTAQSMGNRVELLSDVGVAGVHRLLAHADRLTRANVLIVVAGMEGALASVVGGLVSRPVIAVPTSVGYGASFQGLAPLLTMLNSCTAGVAVVNIDNGFGAGYLASLINRKTIS
jgi:NCAIR mutase (PurE)-related protein